MHDHTHPIRILHLEDSPLDAEMIQEKLETEGLPCEILHVENEAGFAAALAGGDFDVIMCDYNLPHYDGIAALNLAREKQPNAPVMLVSGSLGEEDAVKCLHLGATDYLIKQRLERLPSAVKRALREAEQHRLRQDAEAQLRESEERFRQLAEQSSDGFWFIALNPRRILYVSPAMERLWGIPAARFYEDAAAWASAIHPADRARFEAAWTSCLQGQSARFEAEYRVTRPDGSVLWVLDTGTPIRKEAGGIVRMGGVTKDITERKQMDAHLLRTQRLESIGTLASGVAHDLNNALAPILMATELLRLEAPGASARHIELIQTSVKRGADMVKQLLTFARGTEGERLLVHPGHLLREMEKLMKVSFPKNIDVQISSGTSLHPVVGDATQLHQVLLNLCVNARDAMPDGGRLTLTAENMELDALYVRAVPEAKPGHYVVWRVMDTGTGIPPEILDRIFEPFFSTKGPDKGTGLGLSTVLGIVRSHAGFIRVYAVPGQGSTFAIYLPAAGAGPVGATPATEAASAFHGNGETILVVDDEAPVREIMRNVLTALNFKVLTAQDGTEALLQVNAKRDELRAVITDLHMPNMDGLALVRVLKSRLPDAGIIVASGRMDEREAKEFKTLNVNALLDKPFTRENLVRTLKTVFEK